MGSLSLLPSTCVVFVVASCRVLRSVEPAPSSGAEHAPKPAQVTTEKQRGAFLAALAGDEDWLYSDEGEAAQAPAFRCGAFLASRHAKH